MLIYMRHAQTDWNAKGYGGEAEVLRGNLDVPPNAAGIQETYAVAEQLCAKYPVVEVRGTPHYLRDKITRDIVAEVCAVPAVDAPELDPYNVGDLSGKSVALVETIIDWLIDFPMVLAPGGESYDNFIQEFAAYHQKAYAEYGGDDSRALVSIVHGNEIRALPFVVEGKPVTAYRHQRVKPSQYVVVH